MILIALGANLESPAGPPILTLTSALGMMGSHHIRVQKASHFYRTPAWPDPSEPPFVNAVVRVQTPLGPAGLLETLHAIEAQFGRVRSISNAPRTLDLDLLDYDGRCEEGPPILPHPRIAERAFVLVPLKDVAPEWRHPGTKNGVDRMLAALPQALRESVRRTEP